MVNPSVESAHKYYKDANNEFKYRFIQGNVLVHSQLQNVQILLIKSLVSAATAEVNVRMCTPCNELYSMLTISVSRKRPGL